MGFRFAVHSFKYFLLLFIAAFAISACQGDGSESGIQDQLTDDIESEDTESDETPIVSNSSIKIGNGGGASFRDGTAAAELITASIDDSNWDIDVVIVDSNNLAVTSVYSVSFSSTCIATGLASISSSQVDTIAGRATANYSSGTCDGVDTVVASIQIGSGTISAQVDLDIDTALASSGGAIGASTILMGSGSGTSFVNGTLGASVTNLQAGASATISANIVDSDNVPYTQPIVVTFSSECASTSLASFSESGVLTNGGLASVIYSAEGCSGDDTISASALTSDAQELSASVLVSIATDTVLGVEFISNSESTLTIAGIGGDETANVTFRVVGAQGAAIVGETVSFELSNIAGGSRIASGTESGETNNAGEITTVIQSGTVNASLHVIATHNSSGVHGFSDDITISTGVPISRSFDISVLPANPLAWTSNDAEVVITANVSDQFGNAPPNGTRVSFRSVEVGIIDASCELINGRCTANWRSSGDRNHITAEADDGIGYNNRLGRATVIGFMSGAEDFIDLNANGLFDASSAGEVASVVDLPEAYIDANEDGVFNSTEIFIDSFLNNPSPSDSIAGALNESYDTVGDGIYNGPCSVLINSNCPPSALQSTTIWDQAVIALSSDQVQICDRGTLPPVGSIIDAPFSVSGVEICDENGNSLPDRTTIVFNETEIDLVGVVRYTIAGDTTEPAGPFNLEILPEGLEQENASFTISVVSAAGVEVQYHWPVNEYP